MGKDLEKEELIEMMAIHFRNQQLVPPLAAKIWAILVIENQTKGISFDDLLKKLGVSKSSLSVNLNLLLKTKRIEYSNVEGERKKYFKSRPFSRFFSRTLRNISFEKKLLEKVIQYKLKTSGKDDPALERIEIFKSHLEEARKLIKRILDDLVKIEKQTLNN